jgi:hypothetical protein
MVRDEKGLQRRLIKLLQEEHLEHNWTLETAYGQG